MLGHLFDQGLACLGKGSTVVYLYGSHGYRGTVPAAVHRLFDGNHNGNHSLEHRCFEPESLSRKDVSLGRVRDCGCPRGGCSRRFLDESQHAHKLLGHSSTLLRAQNVFQLISTNSVPLEQPARVLRRHDLSKQVVPSAFFRFTSHPRVKLSRRRRQRGGGGAYRTAADGWTRKPQRQCAHELGTAEAAAIFPKPRNGGALFTVVAVEAATLLRTPEQAFAAYEEDENRELHSERALWYIVRVIRTYNNARERTRVPVYLSRTERD